VTYCKNRDTEADESGPRNSSGRRPPNVHLTDEDVIRDSEP
jgi:hypothetical protein